MTASTLIQMRQVGVLLVKAVHLQRAHTTPMAVVRDIAQRIKDKTSSRRRANKLGVSASQLNRIYQFGRDWKPPEVEILDHAGVPWRLVIQLLPYRQKARLLERYDETQEAATLRRRTNQLLQTLKQPTRRQRPAVLIDRWLAENQDRLTPSQPRVDARLAPAAKRRLEQVEEFLNKARRRNPTVAIDARQVRTAVKQLHRAIRKAGAGMGVQW